jgi:hypothetical protein
MSSSMKSTLIRVLCGVAILTTVACSPRKIPPASVADLMDDKVKLDGLILKCNADTGASRNDIECLNARVAVERLARQRDPSDEAKRSEDFERRREELRAAQEKQRQEKEAKTKVDAYHLPVIPVESTPAPKDPQSPIVGQANQ